MGKAYSAPVGLGPVTDPISFVTREALGLEHAFSPDLSLEVEIKLVWIFIVPWQAMMQLFEAMPANAPLDLRAEPCRSAFPSAPPAAGCAR